MDYLPMNFERYLIKLFISASFSEVLKIPSLLTFEVLPAYVITKLLLKGSFLSLPKFKSPKSSGLNWFALQKSL